MSAALITLAEQLMHLTISVSFLVVLVLLLRKPVAHFFGAKIAYALWLLPLTRLIAPFLPRGWTPTWLTLPEFSTPGAIAQMPQVVRGDVPAIDPVPPVVDPALPELSGAVHLIEPWIATIAVFWLIGMVVRLGFSAWQQRTYWRNISQQFIPLSPTLHTVVTIAAKQVGLRDKTIVRMSRAVEEVQVCGFIRPIIFLPHTFERDFSADEQQAALLHEMTHVKRCDLFALSLANIFLALQWFNPLLHLAMHAFRSDQEAACDEDVLRHAVCTPHIYGGTLVKAARAGVPQAATPPSYALPLSHSIKERIILMQNPLRSKPRQLLGAALIFFASAIALVIATPASAFGNNSGKLKITDSQITVNDRTATDRGMVLLTDPFDGFHAKLDFELERELAELDELEIDIPDFDDIEPPSEFFTVTEDVVDGKKRTIIIEDEAAMEKWEVEMQAKAAAWEVEHKEMEKRHKEIEQKAHAIEKRVAAAVEAEQGNAHTALFDMASQCLDAQFTGPAVIVSSKNGDSKTETALCYKGGKKEKQSEEVKKFVKNHPQLSEAEKVTFFDNIKGTHTIEIKID